MPTTELLFYQEVPGDVPVLDWLESLAEKDRRAFNKCQEALGWLEMLGFELRRPMADLLEDGIYELRVRVGNVNYRILYFFHGRNVAVLTHSFSKEREIPKADLVRAKQRKALFEGDPETHTFQE